MCWGIVGGIEAPPRRVSTLCAISIAPICTYYCIKYILYHQGRVLEIGIWSFRELTWLTNPRMYEGKPTPAPPVGHHSKFTIAYQPMVENLPSAIGGAMPHFTPRI